MQRKRKFPGQKYVRAAVNTRRDSGTWRGERLGASPALGAEAAAMECELSITDTQAHSPPKEPVLHLPTPRCCIGDKWFSVLLEASADEDSRAHHGSAGWNSHMLSPMSIPGQSGSVLVCPILI